ncbi:cerebellin-2-like [Saccostrea cucullata]|uniref:cerebellin-2-like n=1 Tax=Saccostrea cuccullata TaxID=36930 RepID=UPI002ED6ABEA
MMVEMRKSSLILAAKILSVSFIFPVNSFSLLTGNDSNGIESLGNTSSPREADILRQIVNQESLVRMSMVQSLQALMIDMLTCKNNYDTLKKEVEAIRRENQKIIEKNSDLDQKVMNLSKTVILDGFSLENFENGQQSILEQLSVVKETHRELAGKVNSTLGSVNEDLLSAKNHGVAFSAFMSSAKNYGQDQTWIFDTVLVNEGNHFNRASGTFTSPSAGTYVFSWATLTNPGNAAHPYLRVNGVYKGKTAFNQLNSKQQLWSSGSNSIVLSLKEGDRVNIASGYLGAYAREEFSSFSGWKLF